MKIKYLLFCVALLLPLITFAGATIHQQLIDRAAKWDIYLSQEPTSITNGNTTVQRFEGKGTKTKTNIDDYFVVSIKNNRGKISKIYKFNAPYNRTTYPDIDKGEFGERIGTIINISPSNKYMYIETKGYEGNNSYLIRLSDGKVIYTFNTSGRATRTPDKQRFIVGGYLGMGTMDSLRISHRSDISKYTEIKLNGDTKSIIANNKTVQIYLIRYESINQGEISNGYIEEYDLETGKLISSKKIKKPTL